MIQVMPQMRIRVAIEAADFRRGIDGLSQPCRASLSVDPFAGALFVFRNRRHTAIKLLVYDGQGFWLRHKRLSKGRLKRVAFVAGRCRSRRPAGARAPGSHLRGRSLGDAGSAGLA